VGVVLICECVLIFVCFDVLNTLPLNTNTNGQVCVRVEGSKTTNYANGCDGGQASLVNDYAVDHGLIEAPCHKYEQTGGMLKLCCK